MAKLSDKALDDLKKKLIEKDLSYVKIIEERLMEFLESELDKGKIKRLLREAKFIRDLATNAQSKTLRQRAKRLLKSL